MNEIQNVDRIKNYNQQNFMTVYVIHWKTFDLTLLD